MKTLIMIFACSLSALSQKPSPTPQYSESSSEVVNKGPRLPGPSKAGMFVKIDDDSDQAIASAAGTGLYAKTEFESKAEYLKRVRTWTAKTKYPSGKTLEETVLVFSNAPNKDDIATYDAETRQFNISLGDLYTRTMRAIAPDRKGQTLSHPRISFVRLRNGNWNFLDYLTGPKIDMEPQVAKLLKPLLAVAIYGTPVTGDTTGRLIDFVPVRLVVFNSETNEIYAVRDLPDYFTDDQ
jgi:hypothetical protein